MTDTIQFIVGKEYRRSDLHDQYGGSRQGGISPSAKSPLILLFTGETGKQYGYLHDGFREDGTFWYTGEGRHGDMRMIKGNLAIRDSAANGEQLHLFEQTRKGFGASFCVFPQQFCHRRFRVGFALSEERCAF